jgi:hypothetical protein
MWFSVDEDKFKIPFKAIVKNFFIFIWSDSNLNLVLLNSWSIKRFRDLSNDTNVDKNQGFEKLWNPDFGRPFGGCL